MDPVSPPAPIDEAIRRLDELIKQTKDGKLDQAFFMRFYQYLALTPVPKIAYEGPDFVPLQQLQVLSTATKGTKRDCLLTRMTR